MRTVDVAGFTKSNMTEGEFAHKVEKFLEETLGSQFTHISDNFEQNLEFRILIPLETFSDFEVCERCSDVVPVKELKSVQISADAENSVCETCQWDLTENLYKCEGCEEFFLLEDFTDTDKCQTCTDHIHEN